MMPTIGAVKYKAETACHVETMMASQSGQWTESGRGLLCRACVNSCSAGAWTAQEQRSTTQTPCNVTTRSREPVGTECHGHSASRHSSKTCRYYRRVARRDERVPQRVHRCETHCQKHVRRPRRQ